MAITTKINNNDYKKIMALVLPFLVETSGEGTTQATDGGTSTQTQENQINFKDMDSIKKELKLYETYLKNKYNDYYLKNSNDRKLAQDERQMILSFLYPKIRNNSCQSLYNYCYKCHLYKFIDNTTNKFCNQRFDNWNQSCDEYRHQDISICIKCIKKMSDYKIYHNDDNYAPKCPVCHSFTDFHHIDGKDLTRSYICERYAKRCLRFVGSTRKKFDADYRNYVVLPPNGRNREAFGQEGALWSANINSFSYKISVLNRAISPPYRRPLYWDVCRATNFDSNHQLEYIESERPIYHLKQELENLEKIGANQWYLGRIFENVIEAKNELKRREEAGKNELDELA